MIIHTERITYKQGQTIQIIPLFDLHYGNVACDVKALKDLVKNNKNAYFFGGGDWLDSVVVTDKRYRKSVDSSIGDAIIDEQIDGLYEIIKPIRKRI